MNATERAHDYEREHGHFGWVAEAEADAMNRLDLARPMLMELPVSTDIDYAALPETIGVAKWMAIENQGPVGSCGGHARTSCQELAYHAQTRGKTVQLNRMFAYLSAQRKDGIRGDNGSTISGNADAAQEWGTCLEEIWPYTGRYPVGGYSAIPQACWERAGEFKIRSWKPLKNYAETLAWLVNGIGGGDIGIQWNVEPDAQGRVERYSRRGGGHSVALLDWNKRFVDAKGRPYIELFNSWGKEWGVEGRAWIRPDIIDEWCAEQTVVGFSEMATIVPRPFDWKTGSFFA